MALSLIAAMSDSFRRAGVRWFRPMGEATAARLVTELKSRLPNSGNLDNPALQQMLSTRGYYRAGYYLNQALPELTIGYTFDERECALLASLDWSEGTRLFIGSNYTLDRAGRMLTAFYRHSPTKAVLLLEGLVNEYVGRGREQFARKLELDVFDGLMKADGGKAAGQMWRDYFYADADHAVRLLNNLSLRDNGAEMIRTALSGAAALTEDDIPLLQSVMTGANDLHYDLPLAMLDLNDPAVNSAFGGMGLGFLTDQLVRNFLFGAEPDAADKTQISRGLATLGATKAYKFLRYLTWYGQILDYPKAFYAEHPKAKVFAAKMNQSAQAAADAIGPLIIAGIAEARKHII